jgi:Flp pilus assembly protein TadD
MKNSQSGVRTAAISRVLSAAIVVACGCLPGCVSVEFLNFTRKPEAEAPVTINPAMEPPAIDPIAAGQAALELHLAQARELERNGKFEEAVQAYTQIIQRHGNMPQALHRLAVTRDRQGLGDQAKPYYLQALSLDPGNADLHCDYGYSCYLQNDFATAERQYQTALSIDPGLRRAHNNLGQLLARQERTADARRHFAWAGCTEDQTEQNLRFAAEVNRQIQQASTAPPSAPPETGNDARLVQTNSGVAGGQTWQAPVAAQTIAAAPMNVPQTGNPMAAAQTMVAAPMNIQQSGNPMAAEVPAPQASAPRAVIAPNATIPAWPEMDPTGAPIRLTSATNPGETSEFADQAMWTLGDPSMTAAPVAGNHEHSNATARGASLPYYQPPERNPAAIRQTAASATATGPAAQPQRQPSATYSSAAPNSAHARSMDVASSSPQALPQRYALPMVQQQPASAPVQLPPAPQASPQASPQYLAPQTRIPAANPVLTAPQNPAPADAAAYSDYYQAD